MQKKQVLRINRQYLIIREYLQSIFNQFTKRSPSPAREPRSPFDQNQTENRGYGYEHLIGLSVY
ncbi:MAG: hypothetical protein QNJ70_28845 [Xenococcaceae cyanobacterium MO_207.B15]|nr:hypothetical protein [Xenococcaceae cyanobacterium MO_207.B15]